MKESQFNMGLLIILIAIMGYITSLQWTVPQIDEAYVTSVNYDQWRGCTWVYSYDRTITFQGIHKGIEAGNTYEFIYVGRIPWNKLISFQLSNTKQDESK